MKESDCQEPQMKNKTRHCSRLMLFVNISLVSAAMATPGVKYDFEEQTNQFWGTDDDKPFHVVQAGEAVPSQWRPVADTSLGTGLGHYVYATYQEGQTSDLRRLTLFCIGPTGPRCHLNFNTILHIAYELVIATYPQCNNCEDETSAKHRIWTIEHINATEPSDGWTNRSVLIGSHPSTFDIDFIVAVNRSRNFVAFDDIQLVDCDPELLADVTCPEHSFHCEGFQDCLPRDHLCDLREDCLCGEDENGPLCDVIESHPEGYLQLHDCNFDSLECSWYNVISGNNDKFRWRVQNSPPSNSTLHHQKTQSIQPPPDNFLQVHVTYHTPGAASILRSSSLQLQLEDNHLCQVRFWYRNTALKAVLHLELVAISGVSRSVTTLWRHVRSESFPRNASSMKEWKRIVVDVSTVHTNHSYILQFKVTSNSSTDILSQGEVSVHSVSLSPECFHADVILGTCDAVGAHGPTQEQCDLYYRHSMITVWHQGQFAGVQSYKVPENLTYRIQARGSRGHPGERGATEWVNIAGNQGSEVAATFKFYQGDTIFFLIGQPPEETCQPSPGEDKGSATNLAQTHSSHSTERTVFGGGGATVVFIVSSEDKVQVLMIAAGGGGLSHRSRQEFQEMAATSYSNKTISAVATMMSDREADDFFNATLSGSARCPDSTNRSHTCPVGFGAGAEACVTGEHASGANKETMQAKENVNKAKSFSGRSYIHSSALDPSISADSHNGPGFVEIVAENDCGCHTRCLWLDTNMTRPTCLMLRVEAAEVREEQSSHVFLIAAVAAAAVFTTGLITVCVCLYGKRHTLPARHPTSFKKVASFLCPCVDLSRRAMSLSAHVLPKIQRPPAIMHVNPNYDVVTMKCPEQGLKELPRKHLKLTSALGQGAFGEVYYGLLSNVPMVDGDLPVAVKTLPPMCTDQTEMDFLMEAVIVSKFNHPNIVKFIGVCFEQQPHYLVLELLEGGDLKSFLRQARPKWDQPSLLTVLDLLCLCLDISRGCQHLEERHFIHRDIAARNCLLTTKGPNRTAKIADFGMARDIYRSDYYKKAGKAMLPVKWMPPEAFLDGVFTSKTDVWSFGILMWEVFSLGHMPYPGCSNEEVMNLVTQGGRLDPPESCPSPVFDIMVSCWSALPEGRPIFSLIIASLERALKDDDIVSRGLPVFYVPPIINTRGLRLQDNQAPNSVRPKATRGLTNSSNSALSPNTSGDGYLEPLLSHNFRHQSHDSDCRSATYNFNAAVDMQTTGPSSSDAASGRVFIDKGKPSNKPICRTPRVFYKPGSNTHQSPGHASSEALLSSHNSSADNHSSPKEGEGLIYEQRFELRVNLDGPDVSKDHCLSQDVDNEDLKPDEPGASKNKSERKSYTNLPKPPTC